MSTKYLTNHWLTNGEHRHTYTCVTAICSATVELKNQSLQEHHTLPN